MAPLLNPCGSKWLQVVSSIVDIGPTTARAVVALNQLCQVAWNATHISKHVFLAFTHWDDGLLFLQVHQQQYEFDATRTALYKRHSQTNWHKKTWVTFGDIVYINIYVPERHFFQFFLVEFSTPELVNGKALDLWWLWPQPMHPSWQSWLKTNWETQKKKQRNPRSGYIQIIFAASS